MVRSRLLLHVVAALAVGTGALAGLSCGRSKSKGLAAQVENSTSQLQLLTSSDVGQAPAGSPQRTVLEWWRLVQFRNANDTLKSFAPPLRSALKRDGYAMRVFLDFGPWLAHARPRVTSVERSGNHANVFLQVRIGLPLGGKLVKQSELQIAVPLDNRSGTWLFSDATFFVAQSKVLEQSRIKAENTPGR